MKLVAVSAGTARYWLDDAIQTISSELHKAERAAVRSKTGHAGTHPLGGRRADHEVEDDHAGDLTALMSGLAARRPRSERGGEP